MPNNLPHAINSFHGREREIAELQQQLQIRRVITIHGLGGSGKTRLALELARAQLTGDRFPDGIWFVDLAPLVDPDLVAGTVARVLHAGAESDGTPMNALIRAALGKRLLLILDNCEHLLEPCASLVQSLTSTCEAVSVLATSQEALEVDGELRYQIDPLPLPAFEGANAEAWSLERLRLSPAISLFLDRAGEASPRHVAGAAAGDPATVVRICAQLDGVPLALELAAARISDLSLREIADGLETRLALLTRGRRAAAPRHQNLRALFDWSYSLLTERDQRLFARLAVFAGTWTTAAAVAVCGDSEGDEVAPATRLTPDAVRAGVATLVSKSLLEVVRREREPTRYRLLESTRAYARTVLEDVGEAEVLARRHARHYQERFLRHDAFDALLADFHEIEVAIAWAVGKQRDLELGAELVASLIGVWARCCLGTSDLQVGDAAESGPLGRGIVDLLSVLQPAEVLKATQPPDATPEGPFTVHPATSWLEAFKARRVYRANDVIFRSGDDALELHYILDGVISLEEIGVTVGRHELLGEMAFVSPLGKRTATARCVTDVSVLSVGRGEMLDLCTRDAKFRLHITRVITSRLMRDLERLRSRRLLAR